MPDTVQQVREAAARAIYDLHDDFVSFDDAKTRDHGHATALYRTRVGAAEQYAAAAMAVIVPAVTAQIRALHSQTLTEPPRFYSDDIQTVCYACRQPVPCPTVRLCNQLDASVRGEGQ